MNVKNQSTPVLVVGAMLIDVIDDGAGSARAYAGGAGFNTAIGLQRMDVSVTLAAPLARDELADVMREVAGEEGIDLLPLATEEPTAVVYSRRSGGEPSYSFASSKFRRDYILEPSHSHRVSQGTLVVVNSFPMDVTDAVDKLLAFVESGGHTLVIDPNVRPDLIDDLATYRHGFRRLVPRCHLVKLSAQDIAYLELGDPELVVSDLLAKGAGIVVLTMAEHGAQVWRSGSDPVRCGVPARREPVVDTMGAGDAVLARLVAALVGHGHGSVDWHIAIEEAMETAADICRVEGGSPASELRTVSESLKPIVADPTTAANVEDTGVKVSGV